MINSFVRVHNRFDFYRRCCAKWWISSTALNHLKFSISVFVCFYIKEKEIHRAPRPLLLNSGTGDSIVNILYICWRRIKKKRFLLLKKCQPLAHLISSSKKMILILLGSISNSSQYILSLMCLFRMTRSFLPPPPLCVCVRVLVSSWKLFQHLFLWPQFISRLEYRKCSLLFVGKDQIYVSSSAHPHCGFSFSFERLWRKNL